MLGLLRIGSIKLMRSKYISWSYSRKGGTVDVKPIGCGETYKKLVTVTCLLLIAVKCDGWG